MSELEGFAAELKSLTAGKGRYALDFSHYEPVPPPVQQKLVEAYKPIGTKRTEPRCALPAPRWKSRVRPALRLWGTGAAECAASGPADGTRG